MQNNNDIERLLEETPKPTVIEGPHRMRLKYSLMQEMKKETVPMRSWRKTLVWAACLVLIAAFGGWAAQKAYKSFIIAEKVLVEEEYTNPDGTKGSYVVTESVYISSDDPEYSEEKGREQYEEIQNLISEGKGELIKVEESDFGKVYIYKFILSDGEEVAWGAGKPIDSPDQDKITYKEILDLFAQGKGELIEEKVLDSGNRMYLYRITRTDGTSFTFGSDTPLEPEK